MKRVYESPRMFCEEFTVNNAVAACSANTDVTFDCMAGGNRDTSNVLSKSLNMTCTNNAGYVEAVNGSVTAKNSYNYSSDHSNYNKALTWSNSSRSASVSNAFGMLYICEWNTSSQSRGPGGGNSSVENFSTSHWKEGTGTIEHTTGVSGVEHVQIAPVFGDAASVATSC